MFKRALVSCSDKTDLALFLRKFPDLEIVSTGGTAKYLQESGFKVTLVSEVTEHPEILEGRVKTLHPRIHAGLLARAANSLDQKTMAELNIKSFDLVIVNLYPFAEQVAKNAQWSELIDNIDIGGPSMLRSAAKNYESVTVLVDPSDYSLIEASASPTLAQRKNFAAKVFSHTAQYDTLIAKAFIGDPFLNDLHKINLTGDLVHELRYGENPQQKASWFATPGAQGIHQAEILQGKALSYNNILDVEAVTNCLDSKNLKWAVGVKHNNPCAAAQGSEGFEVLKMMLKADPVSIFGGVIATNFQIGAAEAELLNQIFLEVIVAPKFTIDALNSFKAKPNLRLLQLNPPSSVESKIEFKSVTGGFLIQQADFLRSDPNEWRMVGKNSLSSEEIKTIVFGEQVVSALKSNAIALVHQGQTVGLGMGQVNRIDAVHQAISRWKKHHPEIAAPILVSDAFFPFSDIIEVCVQAGIQTLVHPGGSVNDHKVEAAALESGITIVYNQKRHFKH